MNSELEKQRLKVFLTTLGIGALAINFLFLSSCGSRIPAAPYVSQNGTTPAAVVAPATAVAMPSAEERVKIQQQEEARKTAEEHSRFLAQYVDAAFTKTPGVKTVALSVSSGNGNTDRAVASALVSRFQNSTVQILPSFFRPAFITDGFFDKAFNGSDTVSSKLELAKALDELLLARESIDYSTNGPELQNSITAAVELEVSILPLSGLATGQSWIFTSSGVGFSQAAALAMAKERLIKQIAEDKKMSL